MDANEANDALMARHLGTKVSVIRGTTWIVPIYRPVDEQDEPCLLALAAQAGETQDCYYQGFGTDWDRLTGRWEEAYGIDLGPDADTPLLRKIKRAYGKARREANE